MNILIGIDDTDTRLTRGTGFHARQMAAAIEEAGLGTVSGITRHQNYVHTEIAYTSQNSSACLEVKAAEPEPLKSFCSNFLLEIAPEGSDVGLCIAEEDAIGKETEMWGIRAKREVLTKDEAVKIARNNGIFLEGLTGTRDGMIGALAAVGLRKGGNDGRFIWLRRKKELREVEPGFYSPEWLKSHLGVGNIVDMEGNEVETPAEIYLHEWFRPVLRNHLITLIIEKTSENGKDYWRYASKDFIRAHS